MANSIFGQVRGPFSAGAEVLPSEVLSSSSVTKIGISSLWHHFVNINGNRIEIGKTGMYESRDITISSLNFEQDEDNTTFVTYMLDTD